MGRNRAKNDRKGRRNAEQRDTAASGYKREAGRAASRERSSCGKGAHSHKEINEAKKIQEKINIIILYALSKSGYPFIKMGMKWLDIDSGYVRKPFTTFVNKEIENTIKNDLKKIADQNDLSGVKFLDAI